MVQVLEAAMLVPRLEVPSAVDRSMGDIHPLGNPHVQLDPNNIAIIAKAIQDRATSAFNSAELTPALSVLAQCLHVLLGSFEQVIKLQEAEQRTNGLRT